MSRPGTTSRHNGGPLTGRSRTRSIARVDEAERLPPSEPPGDHAPGAAPAHAAADGTPVPAAATDGAPVPGAAAGRPPLPTGTVTFLFTDVEGSTRLVHDLGDRWPPLLERHRTIIRAALAAHGGVEVQTEGDGFFAAFARAPSAVAAAVQAQRDLAAEPWPADAPLRVRMGLHTGDGVADADGSYVGHDVHRAARVAGAGHGGQVLLSETTRALAGTALPAGVSIRELGEHRLKDLRPEPLAQLVVDGLPSDFPPVRSLDARPNNLPTQLTSFVGREHELATAAQLLATTRLLTLTGPGGTGKTRLSLQLAASVADVHLDGVWFVALEPLRDPALVLPTVARTLGVAQRPTESALDALTATMGERRVLLVLDNFEQVIDAAGQVGELLRACPAVRIIVTSRAVLRISGEQEYVVPGLPSPPDTSRLSPRGAREPPRRAAPPRARQAWASTRPCASSSPGPSPCGRTSRSPTRTRPPSRGSAPASTACPSRSSSRRPG